MISIVIPIYNVDQYLRECIESVINQTYTDLEILLIDDGSTDNSGKICDEYKDRDKRIKVVHKENGGLSDARNFGISLSSGEYICFIDSDDYISMYMIETMKQRMDIAEADIAICDKVDIFSDNRQILDKRQEVAPDQIIMNTEEAVQHFLIEDIAGFVVAWNKLYRKKIFLDNGIWYPKGRLHEDCFTTFKTYMVASKIIYIKDKLYYYRHREGSIMCNREIEKELPIIEAYDEILEIVKTAYQELTDAAEYRYILANLFCANRVLTRENKEYLLRFSQNLKTVSVGANKYLKGQRKFRAVILEKRPMLYFMVSKMVYFVRK